MSAPSRRTAVPLLALAGVALGASVVSGCAAGRYNQNFRERSSIDSAEAVFGGNVQLRNAFIASPAKAGQAALVSFALYSPGAAAGDTLTSLTMPELSDQPLQLLSVSGGRQVPVDTIEVQAQSNPGAHTYAARVTGLKSDVLPATYHDAVFAFGALGPQRVQLPVRTIGQVRPGTTVAPTVIPDEPFPAQGGLPGGAVPPVTGSVKDGQG